MAKAAVRESPTEPSAEPASPENVAVLAQRMTELEEKLAASEARVQELENPPTLPAPTPPSRRIFVAPAHKNERVLVQPGKVVSRPNPSAAMDADIRRDGDIWAHFRDGILVTDDPTVISWCEGHSDFCRDALHPRTKAWATLIEAQMVTSTQEARLPKNMDIGRLLEGDVTALVPGESIVDRARQRGE